MSSRPGLLLQRELNLLEKHKDSLGGIQVELFKNSLFHWRVSIQGLLESPWDGGLFRVDLVFNEEYNEKPPVIRFVTVPFHPNIDMRTGRPCLDAVDRYWFTRTPIYCLLIELQTLLSYPTAEEYVNAPAAEIFLTSPHLYNQMVQDSIMASRRIIAGLPPFEQGSEIVNHDEEDEKSDVDSESSSSNNSMDPKLKAIVPSTSAKHTSQPRKPGRNIHHLSFESYYEAWKNLATLSDSNTPVPPSINPIGMSRRKRDMFPELDEVLGRNQHLIYGKFKTMAKAIVKKQVQQKLTRIESMKKLYNLTQSAKPVESQDITAVKNVKELLPFSRPNQQTILKTVIAIDDDQVDQSTETPQFYTKLLMRSGSTFASSRVLLRENVKEETDWEEEADELVDWSRTLDQKLVE